MQAHRYSICTTADVALVAATAKTLLQLITPSTRKAWPEELHIGLKSVTATDVPVLIELRRQSTAGTMTAVTPRALNEGYPAALCTAAEAASAEPTTGDLIEQLLLTPIGGTIIYPWPEGKEPDLAISARIGLIITAPQAQNARAELKFRE